MSQAPTGDDVFTRRVCLQLDGMDAVAVHRDVTYSPTDRGLRFDVYYPREETDDRRWPVVVIVAGYPGTTEPRPTEVTYKGIGWTVSMCQLIAVSGMAAIAYTNRDPVPDLQALLEHIHEHARSLRIDSTRVGILAASGNAPTALATVTEHASRTPACAVFAYGCLLDLDGATDVADAARQFGFANPLAGRTLADLRREIPLFITRAGRDQFPAMNASIDRFVSQGLIENLPITLINHSEGPHAFDLFDDSQTSRDIVRQTLRFLRQHLIPENVAWHTDGAPR
jgi:hypothetical protein